MRPEMPSRAAEQEVEQAGEAPPARKQNLDDKQIILGI